MHSTAIHLRSGDVDHVIGQCVSTDQRKQLLTGLLGEFLGVIQGSQALEPIGSEHAGGDHQGAGARTAADLVYAGNRPEAVAIEG
jgi:hypothetical protein